jgi:hypothetical protein
MIILLKILLVKIKQVEKLARIKQNNNKMYVLAQPVQLNIRKQRSFVLNFLKSSGSQSSCHYEFSLSGILKQRGTKLNLSNRAVGIPYSET